MLPWYPTERRTTARGVTSFALVGRRPDSLTCEGAAPRVWPGARARLGAHGVEAAVDVDHLGRRRREPVRQQGDARFGHGGAVVDVPPERRPLAPDILELREPGDRLGRHGADRAGGHQVDADVLGAELAGQV